MTDLIERFSSRKERLSHVFLKDRLDSAESYDRIAGYFRSSVFDLIGEEIGKTTRVRMVCNADLDPRDLLIAQVERWHEQEDKIQALLEQDRWRKLHEILTAGNVEIRVVSRENAPFVHGKAGIITRPDKTTSSFIGSINESINGWEQSYEMIWEDKSPEAAKWVQDEFDWLWSKGVPLAQAVIDEIGRTADRVEVEIEQMQADPVGLAKSVFIESPLLRRGETLASWQKKFVEVFVEHDRLYGAARLLLADEVGVGKTLSMAATGALSVLMGHGAFLILCPATLTLQWQMELWDKLGLPSYVWGRTPKKGWYDHEGRPAYRYREARDILRCPGQIGIVSTGILTYDGDEAEELLNGKFGMIALDEGHKARIQRGITKKKPMAGKLYRAMEKLGARTRHLVIATATPIQTETEEIWDLIKLLARKHEHVLGRKNASQWWNAKESLDVIRGKRSFFTPEDVWDWLRSPLPPSTEASVFDDIRGEFGIAEKICFTDRTIADLDNLTRNEIDQAIKDGLTGEKGIPLLQSHNPLGRHVVLRRRKALEDAGLMKKIAVNLHPQLGAAPGIFQDNVIRTPYFYEQAYDEVMKFTKAMKTRQKGTGFLGNLMMQRICSSIASGRSTAIKMLESREAKLFDAMDDEDIFEALGDFSKEEFAAAIDEESQYLKRVIDILEGQREDPKGQAVLHYLDDKNWLEKGCIIFSQYYDTAHWAATLISAKYPEEPIALYAGADRSRILLDGKSSRVDREDIKHGVREYRLRVVCATDAACEGLNLQTLGTLINVDLPWNPSRLEQRIGRIKRYGQKRNAVDMANLVYAGTVDEKIYDALSRRMQDRYDILGSIPDTLSDDWIDDLKKNEEEIQGYTKKESPADMFSLRYGDDLRLDRDDRSWEVWTQVVARRDIEDRLMRPWNGRRKVSD